MYLIDIDNIKTLYNMTSDDDSYIEQISEIVESYIHNFCNVKTFEYWDYEITLKNENNKYNNNLIDIIIENYTNITELKKINWIIYTWIRWEDYEIFNKRNIQLSESISFNKFWLARLEITAWFQNTSKEFIDIQKAANILFELIHSSYRNNNNKYRILNDITIWDISKWFNTNEMDSVVFESKKNVVIANIILKKYKLLNALSN